MTPRSKIRLPPHPGAALKDYLERQNPKITQQALANALVINRVNLNEILNEMAGVTPRMALLLSKCLNTSPDLWLNLQQAYDLAIERRVAESSGYLGHVTRLVT